MVRGNGALSGGIAHCVAASLRGFGVAHRSDAAGDFGINRRIHAERFPDISTDLPLLGVAVDERARIESMREDVDRIVPRGLMTLEHALVASGDDVADAAFPEAPGRAAKLTVYCALPACASWRVRFPVSVR